MLRKPPFYLKILGTLVLGGGLASLLLQVAFIRWIQGSLIVELAQRKISRAFEAIDPRYQLEWGDIKGEMGFALRIDHITAGGQEGARTFLTLSKARLNFDLFPGIFFGNVVTTFSFQTLENPLGTVSSLRLSTPINSLSKAIRERSLPLSQLDFTLKDLNMTSLSPIFENSFRSYFRSEKSFSWSGWVEVEGNVAVDASGWHQGSALATLKSIEATHPEINSWRFLPAQAEVLFSHGSWQLKRPFLLETIDGSVRLSVDKESSPLEQLSLRFSLPQKQQEAVRSRYGCSGAAQGRLVLQKGHINCL